MATYHSNHLGNEEEGKGLSSHIDPITGIAKDPLPYDIIREIISHLKTDEQFETLASLAQVNHSVYDLAIPRLYETITIKDGNQEQLAYGLTHRSYITKMACGKCRKLLYYRELIIAGHVHIVATPTRKDLDMNSTRKLILTAAPKTLKPHHFPAMKEAVVAPSSLKSPPGPREEFDEYDRYANDEDHNFDKEKYERRTWSDRMADTRLIGSFIEGLKQTGLSESPITITTPISDTTGRDIVTALFIDLFMSSRPSPRSYHLTDFPLVDRLGYVLATMGRAFIFRGVVHLTCKTRSLLPSPTELLANCLEIYFEEYGYEQGRIFLAGLPPPALSPTALSALTWKQAEERSAVKLFDGIRFSRHFAGWSRAQKWDYYTPRVRLVDADFRPSLEDLMETLVPGPEGREWIVAPCVYADGVAK